ncbi:IS701 family transposase [Streptomyces sp. NPDC020096]
MPIDADPPWPNSAIHHLTCADGLLGTHTAKSSTDAVAAAHQYSGSLGGVGLCQVAVHLAFATRRGHTIIDRALYVTQEWAGDEERRERAGVPEELVFATKPELAAAMLTQACAAGVRASFFTGDEVYGSRALRRTCRALGLGYAVAVRSNHKVTTPGGRLTCTDALALVPAQAWQRMRTGTGSRGARDYDWAMIEVVADDDPDGRTEAGLSVLLARRHRYTRTVSFFRCWSPTPVPLARLVWVVCRRWKIEEDFQLCKSATGLDKGQVITWTPWHRWSTAALAAYAFLAVVTALERDAQHQRDDPDEAGLIPISCPELLRLLRVMILPAPKRDATHALRWSARRRRHQHRARACPPRWHDYADTAP